MKVDEMHCKICGKSPHELLEYTKAAKENGVPVEKFIIDQEGTYNHETGLFYCTDCYIKLGMPLGKA